MLARIRDPERLRVYMEHRGMSCQALADAVVDAQRGKPRKDRFDCSRPLISLLRSGKRTSTQPVRARAIEKVLGVPLGDIFTYTLTNGTRAGGR